MKPPRKPNQLLNNSIKYSGMAIQMAVIISAGVFLGWKIDNSLDLTIPVFTLILSLVSIFIAIYLAVKDFLKPKR